MTVTQDAVKTLISGQIDPYLETDLVSAGAIKAIELGQDEIKVAVELGFYSEKHCRAVEEKLSQLLEAEFSCRATVTCQSRVIAHKVQDRLKPLPNVKNIIAVASGKGGVGKSTTSVNIALSLLKLGAKVGVLDADIYGPSIPTMLGTTEKPKSVDGKSMEPVETLGLQTNSIGFLIAEKDAAIWRAPMAVSALAQLLKETNWKELDYLIVDMPPGTGDIQLTLAQQIPVAASVIVTTPQDLALVDARKGLEMFRKVSIPVLGVVENMSYHICSNCGHEEAIFGQGGGDRLSDATGIPLLGRLPLDKRIRAEADEGRPTALTESELASTYEELATKVAAKLSLRPKDMKGRLPNVVVEQK